MNNKKPINLILLLAVVAQGLYFLILIIMTAFRKPILRQLYQALDLGEAAYRNAALTLFLVRSLIVLLIVSALAWWIKVRSRKNSGLVLPCVLSFVFLWILPAADMLAGIAEAKWAGGFGIEQLVAYSNMISAYCLAADPLQSAASILLAVGAALALYRSRYAVK